MAGPRGTDDLVRGAAVALAGCSVHVSTGGDSGTELSGDKVAAIAESSLEKSVGERPDVECPDSITLKVGETSRCTLTDPSTGTQYGMTVSVKDDASDGSGLYSRSTRLRSPRPERLRAPRRG
ncbi:DUF4333 domain-containing protein [Luteimicrobium subarcticum]|uniref:Uncharacterized protein DUF4333 n=1 Tax=Luteimicrobium subarcticum TaxID=620910 RepID=A0A2M8WSC4_9MICO|nr:DUF4333 domain-containing protein [Luteimicrobium subarcticum]PJI93784.1 uncharacterized protein DUF4333 [Luteimicrobium subarcticum]